MPAAARAIAPFALLLALVACSDPEPPTPETTAAQGAAQAPARHADGPVEGTVSTADGVDIWYEARGAGDTTLLFVHCWSCDHTFWKHQVGPFAADYRVVTLDLGGHGRSGSKREGWSITGLGPDVVAVADALELDRIILVGHSMGGPVSLEAARLMPGRVLGIIAADTLHDVSIEYAEDEVAAFLAAFEADFAGSIRGMFDGMSGSGMEPELREWIIGKAIAADPRVAIALLGDFAGLDLPRMFAEAGVPIRAINAEPGGTVPETNFLINRQFADFEAIVMDGVGHFLQLEAPERFNAHLREFVRELEQR